MTNKVDRRGFFATVLAIPAAVVAVFRPTPFKPPGMSPMTQAFMELDPFAPDGGFLVHQEYAEEILAEFAKIPPELIGDGHDR
jgi:hypothetical protein